MNGTQQDTRRQQVVDGLRALADFLDANPHLESPGRHAPIQLQVFLPDKADAAEQMRAWASAAAGRTRDKTYDDEYARLHVAFSHNVTVYVATARSNVCERVVTGVTTVVESVPDPVEVAKLPTVEVERTTEQVEWICSPLLTDAGSV